MLARLLQTMTQSTELLQADIHSLEEWLLELKQELAVRRSETMGFEWELLAPNLGVLRDPEQRNGWETSAYWGFRTKREAERKLRQLRSQSPATRFSLRKARRLPAYRWEIKAVDISPVLLQDSRQDARQNSQPNLLQNMSCDGKKTIPIYPIQQAAEA